MAHSSTKGVQIKAPTGPRVVVPIVAGIGNAILAVPMLRQLKKAKPDARITVLARTSAMAEPFRRMKDVVGESIVCGTGFGGAVRMVRESRKRRPDLFIVPFPSNRWQYNLLQRLSRGKTRVMHGYEFGRLKTLSFLKATRVPAEEHLHDTVQNLRLLEPLGIKPKLDDNKPVFPLELEEIKSGDRLRGEAKIKGREPYIVMHCGSANTVLAAAKRWPAERYAGLCQAIHRTLKIPVVLVEGPDERGIGAEVTRFLEGGKADVRVLPLTGSLGDAGAFISGALAYVGTDSGLAHLASAVGVPAVTLFAPADPDRVCPAGMRSLVVQTERMCSPCMQYPWKATSPKISCSPPLCIEAIMVEQVMRKLQLALNPKS